MRISIVIERKDPATHDYWEDEDPYEPSDNPYEHWFSFHKRINTRRMRKMLKAMSGHPVCMHALELDDDLERVIHRGAMWWDRKEEDV